MTDLDRDIRTAFAELAAQAGGGQGSKTAELAIAADRRQRRSQAGWAAAAVAVVLTGVGINSVSPSVHADHMTGSVAASAERNSGLYDVPTRGSLAGDADFLAGVRDLEWSGPLGVDGAVASPAASTHRVVFAGEVPGGERWAVVMGMIGEQQVWAWFLGGAGATPEEMTLAADPARGGASQSIALIDSRRPTGPLLVLGSPGDAVEYSPSLDRDASGALVRTFTPLPAVAGVHLGAVTTPITAGAGEVHVLRNGVTVAKPSPTTPNRLLATATASPTGDPALLGERMKSCLEPLGFTVELFGADAYETVSGPSGLRPLSTAEQAQEQALERQCARQLGYW